MVLADEGHSLIEGNAAHHFLDIILHLLAIGSAEIRHHSFSRLHI